MAKYRYGFKLVREKNGGLFSAFNDGRALAYAIEEETTPYTKDGPLAVFNTIEEVVAFVMEDGRGRKMLKLYRCKYIPYKGRRRVWVKYGDDEKRLYNPFELPKGTRLATEVTLTSKVGRDEYSV